MANRHIQETRIIQLIEDENGNIHEYTIWLEPSLTPDISELAGGEVFSAVVELQGRKYVRSERAMTSAVNSDRQRLYPDTDVASDENDESGG